MDMTPIPGYTMIRPLGRGGMAAVYLARQESLNREVALKLLSPGHESEAAVASERFLREARIAANLRHPHIVTIHDFGVHDGVAYLAMEYEPGGTIAPLAGEKLAPRDALRLVRDIAGALDYAHGHGVVHRDIKPDNILRRADGKAMLTDFGIARLIMDDTALTAEGTSVGTPQYMSPEQLRGEKVDGRSDLYSLGIVLWQLLTGDLPYTGSDSWAIGTQHISAPIPRLPEGLAHLQSLLESLLAKRPEARLESGAELVRRIDLVLASTPTPNTSPQTVAADSHVVLETSNLPPHTRRTTRMTLVAVAFMAVATLGWFGWNRLILIAPGAQVRAPVAASHVASPGASESSAKPAPLDAVKTSIAVLPFLNISADPEQAYFSDGLSEDLITALSQSPALRVIGRTSSFRFRGHDDDSRTIGAKLGVTHLLSGSVRRVGDVVRISADLVKVDDGSTLWSQHFDRPYRDLFKLQDEITVAVATALNAKLSRGAASQAQGDRPASGNLAAFTAFLQGRFHSGKNTLEEVRAALADLDRAIALDPGYAQAYAARSYVQTDLVSYFGSNEVDASKAFARARSDALRAQAIDPGLGSAHVALGFLAQNRDLDMRAAESEYRQAVQLSPDDPRAWEQVADTQALLGRLDEAVASANHALRLDPLNVGIYAILASIELVRGNLGVAEQEIGKAIELEPGVGLKYTLLSKIAIRRGDAAAAMRAALKAPPGFWREYSIMRAAQIGKDRGVADTMLKNFIAHQADFGAFQIAEVYALRKNPDQMMAWLERARRQHDPGVTSLLRSPYILDYRSDPRLVAFSESVGVPISGLPDPDSARP